jgi:hypothetical protein
MLSLDRHIAVSAGWIAGPAAGVAIMGAPGALGITSQATSEACFYGGLCVFALTILAVLVHSLRERGSRQDKMWPILLMASGTLLLLTGATACFWPHARIISGYRGEITGVAAFTVNGQPGLLNVIPSLGSKISWEAPPAISPALRSESISRAASKKRSKRNQSLTNKSLEAPKVKPRSIPATRYGEEKGHLR